MELEQLSVAKVDSAMLSSEVLQVRQVGLWGLSSKSIYYSLLPLCGCWQVSQGYTVSLGSRDRALHA